MRLAVPLAALVLASAAWAQSPVTQPQRPGAPKLDVDFEATPAAVVNGMLDIANVGRDDIVMDLGCGEGDISNAAARLKGARAICVELDPERIAKAREKARQQGVAERITFIEGDLFKADLTPATVITLFLWDTINLRLRPKLLDLKAGTRIVSHAHDMGDWRPDKTEWHNRRSKDGPSAVHLWIVPAKVAGRWQLRLGGEEFEVSLAQRYQMLSGTVNGPRGAGAIRNGRVRGEEMSFTFVRAGKMVSIAGRLASDTIIADAGSPAFEMRRLAAKP